MRLVDPVRGLVVDVTSPRTIIHLMYGCGYWKAHDDNRPSEKPELDTSGRDDPRRSRVD